MKKIVSLILSSSILVSNYNILAFTSSFVDTKYSYASSSELQKESELKKQQELYKGWDFQKESSCPTCDVNKNCVKNQNLCKAFRVARSVLTTAVVLGTFAAIKGVSMYINRKARSIPSFLIYKSLLGVAGACLSVASLVGIGENFNDAFKAADEGDRGMVTKFCIGLNLVNIFASFYNLKSILTQKFVLQM